jgi:hypothetical protein
VYIPSTIGTPYNYAADPDFVPNSTDVGPTGHAQFNMGTSFLRRPATAPASTSANGGAHADVAATPTPAATPLPTIGPEGHGNLLIAWDPVAAKERWRGLSAGFNQGGTLSAGNLVFSSVNTRLIAYRADNGDQLIDIPTGLSMMGPPMTFMIDGKQFVTVTGGPPNGGNGFGPPPPETPGVPLQPSRLLVYALDGKATLPKAPAN